MEQRLEQVGDRRLADGTEHQRAHGDAELVDADHQRHVLHRAQRGAGHPRAGLGARLDLGTAGGDQGELRGHEERVAEQQEQDREDDGASRCSCVARPRSSPAVGLVEQAQREPVDAQPVHVLDGEHRELLRAGSSGVGAVGDRHLGDVAALGHPAEHLQHQPGDGVVVLVVGQLDAGEVLDLVGAQQPGERPGAVAALAGPGARAGRARRRCRRRSPR